MPNFVTRTPKNNRVKVNGIWYEAPSDYCPPDNRFDGRRWIFGLYNGTNTLISLWGSEAYWKEITRVGDTLQMPRQGEFRLNSAMYLEEISVTSLPWLFWRMVE
jgi:hypothetical protein